MKSIIVLTLAALVSISAFAHDPKEHAKEKNQAPDCAAMEAMEHGNTRMDKDDPVMKAMQAKCMQAMKAKNMKGMEGMKPKHDGEDVHDESATEEDEADGHTAHHD